MTSPPVRVGDLRPSQLLWAFGVGAVVDLPNFSVVVRGLDDWDEHQCAPIGEERLLAAVRSRLGGQITQLRSAPTSDELNGGFDPYSDAAKIGVPVTPFPGWLRCPVCQTLGEVGTGVFKFQSNIFRSDQNRYVHETCAKAKKPPTAVPARFVVACAAGHLDDFPWRYFVHRGQPGCKGALRFYEVGASLETRNLFVECTGGCGSPARSMIEAFGESGRKALPRCRGHHPHLASYGEGCGEPLRAMLLGASNGWFPETLNLLSVPTKEGKLAQLVDESWVKLAVVTSVEVLEAFRQIGQLGALAQYENDEIWEAIEARRATEAGDGAGEEGVLDLKTPEWHVFANPNPALYGRDFRLAKVDPPSEVEGRVAGVVLAERLREVNALTGFTRIQPPGEMNLEHGGSGRGPLVAAHAPTWVPATETRGEGVFLRFSLEPLKDWLAQSSVTDRNAQLRHANADWRSARRLGPADAGYPGIVYVMLHSFAHALMRELVLECGYGAASVRERIYASSADPIEMAGVLIYTAAPDSEGTLGGLVRLGRPEELGRLIRQALGRAQLCASDPLCSEHDPTKDGSLHGAACHACLFAPETSCEIGNRFLDRTLIVPTFRATAAAFFSPVS